MRAFEDFSPGTVTRYGDTSVSRDDIVAFARAYDPQPMHMDEDEARKSFVGGLIGSGWHSCTLMMRMIADHALSRATSMGSPGIDEVKWLRPLRPGARLSVREEVLEVKESRSRPDMGLVRFRFELLDGDEALLEQTNWIMFGRRHPAEPAPAAGEKRAARPVAARPAEPALAARPGFFEDRVVGEVWHLGSHAFTADDIKTFAAAYDPQPFHLDEAAAAASHFGALCASGWHTAAMWMRLMVENRRRDTPADGARLGPSPGFRDLKWIRPVYAGDTIRYTSTTTAIRPSASRPGWGLVFHHNEGFNQRDEPVFSFDGCVFWERRRG